MKNIRILEDGNRLIVVLEGYEKNAVNALIEMLRTVSKPLSHIKPHTGEADFQLKGTEKEVPLPDRANGQEPEKEARTGIKRPAFVEQMQSDKAAVAKNATTTKAAEKTPPAKEADATKAETSEKPVKQATQATGMSQEEEEGTFVPPETPDDFMPAPGASAPKEPDGEAKAPETPEAVEAPKAAETAEEAAETARADEASEAETAKAAEAAGTAEAKVEAPVSAAPTKPVKPAEFMNSFELRAYIQQTDKAKLSAILRRKGRFPNMACLLNANDRTLREYVKELLLTA